MASPLSQNLYFLLPGPGVYHIEICTATQVEPEPSLHEVPEANRPNHHVTTFQVADNEFHLGRVAPPRWRA